MLVGRRVIIAESELEDVASCRVMNKLGVGSGDLANA